MRALTERLPFRAALAGLVIALAFAVLASIGAAVSPSGTPAATEQYPARVTICHKTKSKKNPYRTIRVARSAVRAHLRHGDKRGSCARATFRVCHKIKVQGKVKAKRTVRVKGLVRLKRHLRHGDKLGPCKKAKKAKKKGKK
jgi:hypothetical protein